MRAALIVTVQGPVPEQPATFQPTKTEPAAAFAVKVTCEPARKAAEHVVPQSIPGVVLVTDPVPRPAFPTVSTNVGSKMA